MFIFFLLFSERMSASVKEEPMLEELEMKSSIKESSSTLKPVEDICTVYVKEEDVKMEGIHTLHIYLKL